jgi:hypothetical protein
VQVRIVNIVASVKSTSGFSRLGRSWRRPRPRRAPKAGAERDREARAIDRKTCSGDSSETVKIRAGEMHDNPATGRHDDGTASDADKRPQRAAGGLERGR